MYFRPGYEVYVTPVGGSLVNVAVLLDAKKARGLGGRLEDAFDELAVEGAPRLRDGKRMDAPLAAGPFPAAATRRWQATLCWQVMPVASSTGLRAKGCRWRWSARKSARRRSRRSCRTATRPHFARYDRAITALQRPSTLMARLSLALASRPALGRRAIANLARRPETFARLIRVSQGETALLSLRPRDALALLFGV